MNPEETKADQARSESAAGKGSSRRTAIGEAGRPGKPIEVKTRSIQYLVTARQGGALHPMQAANMTFDALERMEGVSVVKRLKPSGFTTLSNLGASADVLVAETSRERGIELQQTANRDLIVEPNHHLIHLGLASRFAVSQPDVPPSLAAGIPIHLKVVGKDSKAMQSAEVTLFGRGLPQQTVTDDAGYATLMIYGGTPDSVSALYVKPFANFWERWMVTPALDPANVNVIRLNPLEDFPDAGFPGPGKRFIGWGQKLMGLDKREDRDARGRGVKVAIIDSGCDNNHPALNKIKLGLDLTAQDVTSGDPFHDDMGHGTHCAGIIAGNGIDSIEGFVPAAEVHILKLFPGGQFDDLIAALAYCIDNRIDVVNCSLGAEQASEAVQQRIDQARQAGVAVIVAAGNSSGPVQFPAQLPTVVSVAAIGEQGEFPADTYHAQTVPPDPTLRARDLFAAKFTCNGTQISVCGPGVAIISSVPGNGYAAWDGTSMAAPHLTGLAALLLADNPGLLGAPRASARVDNLFRLLMSKASDLGLPRDYEGVGLPAVAPIASAAISKAGINLSQLEILVRQQVVAALTSAARPQAAYPQFSGYRM